MATAVSSSIYISMRYACTYMDIASPGPWPAPWWDSHSTGGRP